MTVEDQRLIVSVGTSMEWESLDIISSVECGDTGIAIYHVSMDVASLFQDSDLNRFEEFLWDSVWFC
jgi:hypothetical protein